jgi:antitoxin VapB
MAQRAKLFRNGGSQAVRLPKSFRLPGKEVLIRRDGPRIILEPPQETWSPQFLEAFRGPPDESFPPRAQPRSYERKRIKL